MRGLFIVALLVVVSSSAHAQLDAPPVAAAPRTGWYGWQMLAADLAGAGVGYAVASQNTGPKERNTLYPVVGTYALSSLSGPSMHLAYGKRAVAAASLGMHVAGPPILSLVSLSVYCTAREYRTGCAAPAARWGFAAGVLAAAAVDAGVLAFPNVEAVMPARTWYGWQTLLADGAGLLFGAYFYQRAESRGTLDSFSQRMAIVALGPYVVGAIGGPVVHATHLRFGRAGVDLGIRLAGPPVAAVVGLMGYCAARGGAKGCTETGAVGGLAVGVAGTALADALAIAWDSEVEAAPAVASETATGWVPFLAPGERYTVVGLASAF